MKGDRSHKSRLSADVGIVLVKNLAGSCGASYISSMVVKKTVVMVRLDCIFKRFVFAHELGHVFGASHQINSGDSLFN